MNASEVPDVPLTRALLSRIRPGRTAVAHTGTGRRMTYGALTEAVWAAATGLRHRFGGGAAVGVYIPDSAEHLLAAQAVIAAGLVAVPVPAALNDRADLDDLAGRLARTRTRGLITCPALLELARAVPAGHLISFGSPHGAEPFTALFGSGTRSAATGPAVTAFSRSGRPVRLTHRNLVAVLDRMAGLLTESDVVLAEPPFTDPIAAGTLVLPALRAGATVVARPAGTPFLQVLRDQRVTVTMTSPETLATLAFDRAATGLDALRTVLVAGGPVDVDTAWACEDRLGCTVRPAYGVAEAGGITHLSPGAAKEGTAPGSVGHRLPHVEHRVVEPATGAVRLPYDLGEVQLRGASIASEGWLPTGDRAFTDDDDELFVVGRTTGPAAIHRRRAPAQRSHVDHLQEGW